MRRAFALVIITIVIIGVAYVTKPSEEACLREARMQYEKTVNGLAQTLPATVNKEVFSETLEKAFEQSLEVEDKLVYQAIYQQKGGSKKRIGWGAFGKVSVEIE